MIPDDTLNNRFTVAKAPLVAALARDPVDAVSDAAVLLSALRHRLRDKLREPHPEELEPE